jgi:type II secretory pathway component GspD/PulD (secretin)
VSGFARGVAVLAQMMNPAWAIFACSQLGGPAEADTAGAAELPRADASDPAAPPRQDRTKTAESKEAEPKAPPIYIVPGEGSVTIVCDDPEALDQFEDLLRTLSPRTGYTGRNVSIFELEHARADVVAEKLRELFESGAETWRRGFGSISIVADERLNTIIVKGSRVDRQSVEGLIGILDTDAGDANKPTIIPLRNVDADKMASVIRDVFRSQMAPSTRTGTTRTSGRIVPEVAVDPATNSLVIMAASPLLEEITELATTLDQKAGESPARRVEIIRLEKANATRVQEALDKILDRGARNR